MEYATIHIGMDKETRAKLGVLAAINKVSISKMVKLLTEWAYKEAHFKLSDKDMRRVTKLVKKYKEDLV